MGGTLIHLREARSALNEYARVSRDLALVRADQQLSQTLIRALWAGSAIICVLLAIFFTALWTMWGLHEAGWNAWSLARLSALGFGLPAVLCAFTFLSKRPHVQKTGAAETK